MKIFNFASYASPNPSLLTLITSQFLCPLSLATSLIFSSQLQPASTGGPICRADGFELVDRDGAAGVVRGALVAGEGGVEVVCAHLVFSSEL